MTNQVTTISVFKFHQYKFWAFKQMRQSFNVLKTVKGLSFFKTLGCGAGNGFSIFPDFGTYVLLLTWETEALAIEFFESHPFYKEYDLKSHSRQTIYMNAIGGHGLWDGHNPFQYHEKSNGQQKVVVITRATIKLRKLLNFWKYVPNVSKSMVGAPGLRFALGIGELPLIQQATFSLWESEEDMKNYAYTMKSHKEVVTQTRKQQWYKEEMFTRFFPYKSEGTINDLAL